MFDEKNDRCLKQPNNIGIKCIDHIGCEKCGWNPEYLKKIRLRMKNKKEGKD